MANKKKNRGTQKNTQIADASNVSPPYEIVSITSDTNYVQKNKAKMPYICKCKKSTLNNTDRPKTWNSITKMYGDADTTEVWDNDKHIPKSLFKTKVKNKNEHRKENIKSKSQRTQKLGKKSIISLYRKPKKNKRDHRLKNKPLQMENIDFRSPVINFKVQQKPKFDPLVNDLGTGDVCVNRPCREAVEYYLKTQEVKDNTYDTKTDKQLDKSTKRKHTCKCKTKRNKKHNKMELSEHDIGTFKYNDIITKEKNKKDLKPTNVCKCKITDTINKSQTNNMLHKELESINVGHGDQMLPITTNKRKTIKCKCSFMDKILRHTCTCKFDNEYAFQTVDNAGDQTGEPFFEIKVDSSNMNVLNAAEIKNNVKTYGRFQRRSCICPSRLQRKIDACGKGICEKALRNKQTNFDCKCIVKNNIIECKDSTCATNNKRIINRKKKPEKNKFYQSPTFAEKNNPLFEVMLDPVNMKIINTSEIHDIFEQVSANEVCPTGVCNIAAKDKHIQLNCKCIGKKLVPKITECTERTCNERGSKRKCKLSYLCSRVFSKSENWNRPDNNINRHRRDIKPAGTVRKKENINTRSDTHRRNGLTINVSRDRNYKQRDVKQPTTEVPDITCKCFCECDVKEVTTKDVEKELLREDNQKKKKGKSKVKNKKGKSKVKNKKSMCKKHKQLIIHRQNMTFKERILYCLKRKRVRCQRKLKKEEKAFVDKEKKTIKENRKIKRTQDNSKKIEAQQWNCLTKFLSGFLNLTADSIKNIILAFFSLIVNPIGSYVYVRERSKDPPGTIKRFKDWIIRTWRNKSGKLSQSIKDSETMNVIADQIEDSAIYDKLFANKGRTKEERAHYENKSRIRKRRIRKRQDLALYGCRHMLLTTMRKTPCLWFYHICPDLYPQCLSLVAFMNNFLSVIIYLLAFICWTPCIVSFEMCRAFLCCFLCTN